MLTITVDDSLLRAYLQQLQGRMNNLSPVMADIGQALESRVRQSFETRTDPMGNAWAPWAPSTVKSYPRPGTPAATKAGRSGNARLLDRYGGMLEGLGYRAEPTRVSIGFNQPYATYHEFGAPRRKLPRRGLLTASPSTGAMAPKDQRTVLEIVQKFLQAN